MKLLLVGPYPPPYGGIATTVRDLHRYLSGRPGWEVAVLDIGERRREPGGDRIAAPGPSAYLGTLLRFARRGYTIHLETNGHNDKSWLSALACVAAGRLNGGRTVVAFGSGGLPAYLRGARGWRRLVAGLVLRSAGRLICRNLPMREALAEAGAPRERLVVLPGFLGLEATSPAPVPPELAQFLDRHEPVLGVTTGVGPEYGLSLLFAALVALIPVFPRIGLVLMGPGVEPEGEGALRAHVACTGPLPREVALGVMRRLTLFVRPTLIDGDANSVREALELGVPVVASATDYRPPGVLTFRRGDVADLVRAVRQSLEWPEEARRRVEAYRPVEGFARMMTLYRGLAEGAR